MYYRLAIVACGCCGNKHDFITDELPSYPVGGTAVYEFTCPTVNQTIQLVYKSPIAHVPLEAKPEGSVIAKSKGIRQ